MGRACLTEHPAHWITWEELCADESGLLRNVPYKVELNGLNQLIVAPANYQHSRRQARISRLLDRLLRAGEASVEAALLTSDNVKVPDVVWASADFVLRHKDAFVLPVAPEICVEVLSPTNSAAEIEQKIALYLEAGALEVWVCGLNGVMRFHARAGSLERSALCPRFPVTIRL